MQMYIVNLKFLHFSILMHFDLEACYSGVIFVLFEPDLEPNNRFLCVSSISRHTGLNLLQTGTCIWHRFRDDIDVYLCQMHVKPSYTGKALEE